MLCYVYVMLLQMKSCAGETRRLGSLLSHRSAVILSSQVLSLLVAVDVYSPSFTGPTPPLTHTLQHPSATASPHGRLATHPAQTTLLSLLASVVVVVTR